ncbi:MAG: hypothetical protein ACK4K7_04655 [Allosphingosinicella sp.]|uniref:hypothetical protein n=1 Tax=Allosphingosinicella sp. TaxID=2823234 RepID=UPI003960C5F6
MSELELLKEEAARCRRLAAAVTDKRVEETLIQMAVECERRVDGIERNLTLTLRATTDIQIQA